MLVNSSQHKAAHLSIDRCAQNRPKETVLCDHPCPVNALSALIFSEIAVIVVIQVIKKLRDNGPRIFSHQHTIGHEARPTGGPTCLHLPDKFPKREQTSIRRRGRRSWCRRFDVRFCNVCYQPQRFRLTINSQVNSTSKRAERVTCEIHQNIASVPSPDMAGTQIL